MVSLTACTRETTIPDHVMAQDQMVPFLIDIHLAEAKIKVLKLHHDSSMVFYRKLEDDIYEKHHISDSIYKESYDYYMNHPDLLLEIYERVIDSLSLKEKVMSID